MEGLKIYCAADLSAVVTHREGELKTGEKTHLVSTLDEISLSPAKFVLIGIPEDIGVRANSGIAGAASTWPSALKALLNIQSTPFFDGEELLVLGHFEFTDLINNSLSPLQQKVLEIDNIVFPVVQKIVEAGKIPVVVGGGHNNAYPILKGVSLALNKSVDVINIDAHADLRPATGRHSGNGFSHAIKDGYLTRYGIFGLHQNYNNAAILQVITQNPHIYPVFFDDLLKGDKAILSVWSSLIKKTGAVTGLELDLDCIENLLSSAMTPSGFPLNEVRRMILTADKKFAYFHICEGAIELIDGRKDQTTAKAIAYLISDFIKSQK